jgi:hypothetical protein
MSCKPYVPGYGLGLAIHALGVVEARPLVRLEQAHVGLGEPRGFLALHVVHVHDAAVVELCTLLFTSVMNGLSGIGPLETAYPQL